MLKEVIVGLSQCKLSPKVNYWACFATNWATYVFSLMGVIGYTSLSLKQTMLISWASAAESHAATVTIIGPYVVESVPCQGYHRK